MDFREYILYGCCLALLMMSQISSVSSQITATSTTTRDLVYLNSFPTQTMNRYQARCSLPCNGVYNPGGFKVIVAMDQMCHNFRSANFAPTQTSTSSVWYLNNTNTLSANSNNMCVFDIQLDYTSSKLPTGTCSLGWETPTECSMADVDGAVKNGWMTCDDVTRDQLDACYNQTTFSQCCNACNLERRNIDGCPFGDFRPWMCTSLTSDRCYNPSIAENCCETCDEFARDRMQIANCPYGDKDINFCSSIEDFQCYQQEQTCCETCFWNADENQPDCLYGDRRPNICNSILISDCYNNTIANDCCRTCNMLRNNDNPECMYGDKAQFCDNIERRRCYNPTIIDTCCETCVHLADDYYPDCAYGDRRDCSSETQNSCNNIVTNNECCLTCRFLQDNNCRNSDPDYCYSISSRQCYNENTRSECCYTCLNFYAENAHLNEYDDDDYDDDCEYGNKLQRCYKDVTEPHLCYDEDIENLCCESCQQFLYYTLEDIQEECKYGDRTPDSCMYINSTECYDTGIEYDCCETCHYSKITNLPYGCRYGDKDTSTCHMIEPWQCYDPVQQDTCCDSCSWYDQTDELGFDCRYGDRRFDCYNEPDYICYNPEERRECCKFCHNKENPDNVGCEFGDKRAECLTIQSGHCYTLEQECCDTCPYLVSIHYDTLPNCKYGDRRNCSTITTQDCYDTTVSYECCETCLVLSQNNNNAGCLYGDSNANCVNILSWDCYTRDSECCDTCSNYLLQNNAISHCKYGDRSPRCSSIEPHQCYDGAIAYECCDACFNFRKTHLPYSCQYGDKITTCTSSQYHSSACYDNTLRSQCCETCWNIKTNVRDCEYGDKDPQCESVLQMPSVCYNNTVSRVCCQTCPGIADVNYPGCEYGDKYERCLVENCAGYTPGRLQECCSTCYNYIHNGPSTTYSPIWTSTVSPNNPTNTDKQNTSTSPTTTRKRRTSTTTPTTTHKTTKKTTTTTARPTRKPSPSTTRRFSRFTTVYSPTTSTYYTVSTMANKSRDNTIPIIAGTVGGVLFVAIVMIVCCYCIRRSKSASKNRGEKYAVQTMNGVGRNNVPVAQPVQPVPVARPAQTTRPPKLRESRKEEEVYDYINDSDVRSLPSIRRPDVPSRDLTDTAGAAYMEPVSNGAKPNYINPAYEADSSTNEQHVYHILQKQSDVENEYMKM